MGNKTLFKFSTGPILFISFINLFISCSQVKTTEEKTDLSGPGYLGIKNGEFYVDSIPFYPIVLNYHASLIADNGLFWVSPSTGYNPDKFYNYFNPDSASEYLRADFNLIRSLGFNMLRAVSICEFRFSAKDSSELEITAVSNHAGDSTIKLSGNEERYYSALDKFFEIADEAGLKIILLIKMVPGNTTSTNFLRNTAFRLRNHKSLAAYDLYNEPLYFDFTDRSKEEVHEITSSWNKILKENAPHHLSTIGLEGIREVFEWDPNFLEVDFVSLHPYEYEPEQVRNEIYWYGKYIDKPWIIGETAIPADGDSVPYSSQLHFAEKVIQQSFNCGAAGFSWWQYKDVNWQEFHSRYMGVVNDSGETREPVTGMNIGGTVKPVANAFREFKPRAEKRECFFLDNYYNYSSHKHFRVTGFVYDDNDQPVEGAVVLAWNEDWTHSYHTVTLTDGSFDLRSNYKFYHYRISATYYSVIDGHVDPTLAIWKDNILTCDLGKFEIDSLNIK